MTLVDLALLNRDKFKGGELCVNPRTNLKLVGWSNVVAEQGILNEHCYTDGPIFGSFSILNLFRNIYLSILLFIPTGFGEDSYELNIDTVIHNWRKYHYN